MLQTKSTAITLQLDEALHQVGIVTELEHFDGYKHVDIFIPAGKIYIEIDGARHHINAEQIYTDFQRDHFSDDEGFRTLRLANEIVARDAIKIARALKKVLNFATAKTT